MIQVIRNDLASINRPIQLSRNNVFGCLYSTDITLGQRIEYLSRATMCDKSSTLRTTSAVEGEFLHELEEKMEVCLVGNLRF